MLSAFSRTTRLAGRPRADRFSVSCICGQVLTGLREEGHQALPCPVCGQEIFVLGSSPLPPVRAEESASRLESLPEPTTRQERRSKRQAWSRWRSERSAKFRAALSRWLTVPVMVFSLVTTLIVLTVAWRLHHTHLLALEEDFSRDLREGLKSYREGDYQRAAEQLTRAETIHHQLRPEEELSIEFRQSLRESLLFRDLLDEPLSDLLRGADVHSEAVNARLADKVIIIDGKATRREPGVLEFHFVLFIGDAPVRLLARGIDEGTARLAEEGRRFIVVARLGKLSRSADAWTLECQPGQVVLVTTLAAWEKGDGVDEETREIIREQARVMTGEDT